MSPPIKHDNNDATIIKLTKCQSIKSYAEFEDFCKLLENNANLPTNVLQEICYKLTQLTNHIHNNHNDAILSENFITKILNLLLFHISNTDVTFQLLTLFVALCPFHADIFIKIDSLKLLFSCLPTLNQHLQMCVLAFICDCIALKSPMLTTVDEQNRRKEKIVVASSMIIAVLGQYLTKVQPLILNDESKALATNAHNSLLCLGTTVDGYSKYYCGYVFNSCKSTADAVLACGPDDGVQCSHCISYQLTSKLRCITSTSAMPQLKHKRSSVGVATLKAVEYAVGDNEVKPATIFFCESSTCNKKSNIQCSDCIELQISEISRSLTANYVRHILKLLQLLILESINECLDEYDNLHDTLVAFCNCRYQSIKDEALLVICAAIKSFIPSEIPTYLCDFLVLIQQNSECESRFARENVAKSSKCLLDTSLSSLQVSQLITSFCDLITTNKHFHMCRLSNLHSAHTIHIVDSISGINATCNVCKMSLSYDSSHSINTYWHCDFCSETICMSCCDKNKYKDVVSTDIANDVSYATLSLTSIAMLKTVSDQEKATIANVIIPAISSNYNIIFDDGRNTQIVYNLIALMDSHKFDSSIHDRIVSILSHIRTQKVQGLTAVSIEAVNKYLNKIGIPPQHPIMLPTNKAPASPSDVHRISTTASKVEISLSPMHGSVYKPNDGASPTLKSFRESKNSSSSSSSLLEHPSSSCGCCIVT